MNKNFPQPIAEQIWNDKYKLVTNNPDIKDDETVNDTWDRIANACANSSITSGNTGCVVPLSENSRECSVEDYKEALKDFKFLPAGRIIAGAGSGRNVTLFNCYVMGTVPDNISGIFEMLKEAALTMQQGGGIGYDFSTLRPAGSPVKGVDADASGPLTFMDVWNSMCKTIMSAGYRRGAMMATMRCDHPDIEAFITAKQDSARLRMFNMGVLCSDAFMRAVKDDADWDLIHIKPPHLNNPVICGQDGNGNPLYLHKTVRACELWELIMKSTYDYAEPGVIFIDRINEQNNLWYVETICSTNPCGEQPLPPYGACLLGSVNLAKMVKNPFDEPWIDWDEITRTATIGVRILDSVIDMSNFPLPQQKEEALMKRRMGIGITGLADMLFMMNMTYGSDEAAKIASKVMKTITLACYKESIRLASLYGPCPAVRTKEQREKFIQSGFMRNMPVDICNDIRDYGIRNALLTSIAPTGTISMYAGNVSSGIEPIFATEYTRKVLENDGVTHRTEVVQDYAVKIYKEKIESGEISELRNDHLVTAQTLKPEDHLNMLEAIAPWVDSSISKTINCPKSISYDDFEAIYLDAYSRGLKGCTTYRPNDVTGSVLSVESDEKVEPVTITQDHEAALAAVLVNPLDRPENLLGTTYKLRWDTKSFYVTINDYVDHVGRTVPFEIFINSSEMNSMQWTVALTRMISAIFRRGGPVKFIGQELRRISDPSGGFWVGKKFIPSFVALLGQTIEGHLNKLEVVNKIIHTEEGFLPVDAIPKGRCPDCRELTMVETGGCASCTNCGYSKCG